MLPQSTKSTGGSQSQNGVQNRALARLTLFVAMEPLKCRSRGINKQSHFALRFVPSRQ